jgi:hypothetical protein
MILDCYIIIKNNHTLNIFLQTIAIIIPFFTNYPILNPDINYSYNLFLFFFLLSFKIVICGAFVVT